MERAKKKYEKPGIVIRDFSSGKIYGTPEMVAKYKDTCEKGTEEDGNNSESKTINSVTK